MHIIFHQTLIEIDIVKPVHNGHLGEIDKMTIIYTGDLYMKGFDFSTKYCTLVVNKHF
jgi:hypothetical protein